MKQKWSLLFCIVGIFLFGSCVSLAPTAISRNASLNGYKYFYVTPTAERNSVQGGTYGNQYGVYGSTKSNSVSPSEVIAGYLMNRGYIRVPEVNAPDANQTMIFNYGDGNAREGINGHAIEVTIQILNAKTHELLCVCRADAMSSDNETKAIRQAIVKCLDEIFESER